MSEPKKNVAASVLARLKNSARASGSNFNHVLQSYAMERFLHRISISPHAYGVILKGALLLKTIGLPRARPTMDIDLLRKGAADRDSLVALVRECAAIETDDGIKFLTESVVGSDIDKDGGYTGTRVLFEGRMNNVRLPMQIDFGVGDVMVPGPRMITFPHILNGEMELLAYPVQSAMAEKIQAMVALGQANSRMKDFYDVWVCSQNLSFDATLLDAIAATFEKRKTVVPSEIPTAFTREFIASHQSQWNAFTKKILEPDLAGKFAEIVAAVQDFAMPAMQAVVRGEQISWSPAEGWNPSKVSAEEESYAP